MSKHMRSPGITVRASSAASASVAMMKLPIGSTRRRSSGATPSTYALVATSTSPASTDAAGRRSPGTRRRVASMRVARVRWCTSAPPATARASECGMELGRVNRRGPLEQEPACVRRRCRSPRRARRAGRNRDRLAARVATRPPTSSQSRTWRRWWASSRPPLARQSQSMPLLRHEVARGRRRRRASASTSAPPECRRGGSPAHPARA